MSVCAVRLSFESAVFPTFSDRTSQSWWGNYETTHFRSYSLKNALCSRHIWCVYESIQALSVKLLFLCCFQSFSGRVIYICGVAIGESMALCVCVCGVWIMALLSLQCSEDLCCPLLTSPRMSHQTDLCMVFIFSILNIWKSFGIRKTILTLGLYWR